jgi:hypothetical protein
MCQSRSFRQHVPLENLPPVLEPYQDNRQFRDPIRIEHGDLGWLETQMTCG